MRAVARGCAVTLISGVRSGITMVALMPSRPRVVGDALGVVARGRGDDAARCAPPAVSISILLSAPRSLKDAGALQVLQLEVEPRAAGLREVVRAGQGVR